MLTELRVRELALVEAADVRFKPGLNLLTGETGSGKSLIVDALGLTLGGRAQLDQVRHGAERAVAEAVFAIPQPSRAAELLAARGLDGEGVAVLARELGKRSSARLNGHGVAPPQLREVAETLIAILGQASSGAHHPLRDPDEQMLLLDRFGRALENRARLASAHAQWQAARGRLAELERLHARGRREEEYLRWQLSELEEAQLRPGEEAELLAGRQVLRHATRLTELSGEAAAGLGETVAEQLGAALARLESAAELDERLQAPAERLRLAAGELRELAAEVRHYGEAIDADPGRLEVLESRLAVLESVKRRFGGTLESAIESRDRLRAQLGHGEDLEGAIAGAEREVEDARASAEAAALELSGVRREAARRMGRLVSAELSNLRLEGARFEVELVPQELTATGSESVAMKFSANPGEPPAPVQRVASGGELARLMLAICTVSADVEQVPTLIFDEVDAGIGGEAALRVGRRLKQLAASRQVLVVTHLPQIACFADHHLLVEKAPSAGGRNVVRVRELESDSEKASELARMMSGQVTEKALARASELLEEAAV